MQRVLWQLCGSSSLVAKTLFQLQILSTALPDMPPSASQRAAQQEHSRTHFVPPCHGKHIARTRIAAPVLHKQGTCSIANLTPRNQALICCLYSPYSHVTPSTKIKHVCIPPAPDVPCFQSHTSPPFPQQCSPSSNPHYKLSLSTHLFVCLLPCDAGSLGHQGFQDGIC